MVPKLTRRLEKEIVQNVTKSLVQNSLPICMQDDHTPSTAIEKEPNITDLKNHVEKRHAKKNI